jgi:hypothetical protein
VGCAAIVDAGELVEGDHSGAVGVGGLDPNRLCRVMGEVTPGGHCARHDVHRIVDTVGAEVGFLRGAIAAVSSASIRWMRVAWA